MADIGEIICTARCTDIWSLGRRGFWRMGRVTDGYRCRCCCVRMAISKITSSNYIAIYSNDGFGQLYHPSVAFWACQGAIGFWDRKKNMIVQQENPKKSARKHRMLSSVSFPLKASHRESTRTGTAGMCNTRRNDPRLVRMNVERSGMRKSPSHDHIFITK